MTPEPDRAGPAPDVKPPATQAEPDYWCSQHLALALRAAAPRHPRHREVLATLSREVADRHPPTGPTSDSAGVEHPGKEGVRLLTWGDPYLTAWLEAVRGEPPDEGDDRTAGLRGDRNPLR